MATRHWRSEFTQTPELMLSDSEDSYSSSDEELPDREETDLLLRQAHHYVITEGGKDSHSTYMERIQRINRDLIQEISRHSYDCDSKLYRRVKHKIDHVLREFEDAADADSSLLDYDQMPGYYTAVGEGTVCRVGTTLATPDGPSARLNMKRSGKDDLQRTYTYGGPDNHPENWHKTTALSVLYPESIRVAEWESSEIYWRLAATGDAEKKNPMSFKGISFDGPRLEHHNYKSQYESASRCKLPANDSADMAKINKFCTVARLAKAVDAFGQHDDSDYKEDDEQYRYAPQVFLPRLAVGQQLCPAALVDDIRKAVNTTPTKPRRTSASDPGLKRSHIVKVEHDDLSMALSSSVSNPSYPLIPILDTSPCRIRGVSSAVQRIKAATEASIRSSSVPQSPSAPSKTMQAFATTKPSCCSRQNTLSAPRDPKVPANQKTATGKRKRRSASAVEEEVEIENEVEMVATKRARKAKKPARPETPTMTMQSEPLHTPILTPALTMKSISASSVASTPPVVKARAAGKRQRKMRTKRDFEERVTPERYAEIMAQRENASAQGHESLARGRTRSGKLRLM